MKKTIIITIAFVLAFVSFFSSTPITSEASDRLTDVNSAEVNRLTSQNIVKGFPNNEFRPKQNVTRAEAAVMIGRALGLNEGVTDTIFTDVPNHHFAAGFIASATERGIISGRTLNTYKPDDPLKRAEMAAILTRAFNYEQERHVSFIDVTPAHFFQREILQLANSGITAGYPDNTFRPERSINRLEFSLMLARTLYPEYRPETKSVDLEGTIATGTVVRTDTLNVRPHNSTTYAPIGKLTRGTQVSVHDIVGNWAFISTGAIRGYVSMSYLTLAYSSNALQGKTIVIDPGHGGSDPGAVANGMREKDIALDVSLRLEAKLKQAGANVVMTRRTDWYPSLSGRANMANNANADIFVSVHANAAGSTAAVGTETFYNTTYQAVQSRILAEALQKQMLAKLQTVNRGVKTANFAVIRQTTMPSVLVELGFMTNYAEAQRLKTSQFREDAANALLDGIFDYFN